MPSLFKRFSKTRFKEMFKGIQFTLTVAMCAVALAATITVAILIYNKLAAIMEDNLTTNSAQVVGQVADTINVYVQDMIDVSETIIGDINTYNSTSQRLREVLRTTQRVRRDIAAVTIVNSRGKLVAYAPVNYTVKDSVDVLAQETFPKGPFPDSEYLFSPPHVQNLFKGQYSWVVTLYRNITMHDVGSSDYNLTLMIDMNFSSIDKYCSQLRIGKRGYVYILDAQNNIIYHPQQHVIYSGLKSEDLEFVSDKEQGTYVQNGNTIITIEPIVHTDWKLVGVSYVEDYATMYRDIVRYIAVVAVFVLGLVLLLAALTSQRISRPIRSLVARMEDVEAANFGEHVPESNGAFTEVQRLSGSYNKMVDRIGELMEQVKQEEQQLRKSELRALQAQINPHFLYNTLDSILWMCEQGQGERAVTMVSALSRLFRISISKGAEIITIREELIHAQSYLTIQKMRYRDQFTYRMEVDESLLDNQCLKILIQPFLENAIYHGIERMVDPGELIIRVQEREDRIRIQVEDNGLGMEPEMVEKILSGEWGQQFGIGIRNVHHRIQIYFGKEYGVEIDSTPDEGTTVNIWLPKKSKEEPQV